MNGENCPIDICLNQGRSDYGSRELCEGEENCLKYLKKGSNRKEAKGNKDFKKRWGKLGQGAGALKKEGGGAGTPLRPS